MAPVVRRTRRSCAALLRALADETRLAVVRRLFRGPARVEELRRHLKVEQSLLSHHLRTLREAGLLVADREGKGFRYRLSDAAGAMVSHSAVDLGCCTLTFDAKAAGPAISPAPRSRRPR